MEDVKIRYCNLCLTTISNEDDFLILKLGFDDDSKHEICNVCSAKLSAAQKFKFTCSYTDNTINSYANKTKVLPLDLRDFYMKERRNEQLSEDMQICRLCMQPINKSELIAISEEQVDMIHKLVPEMNIFIVEEPVTCKLCLDSLVEHSSFLTKCWNVKQNTVYISNEPGTDGSSHVPQVNISTKIEDIDMEFEDVPELIKTEYVDTNYKKSVSHGQDITSEAQVCMCSCEKHNRGVPIESGKSSCCLVSHVSELKDSLEVQIYKCENCDFQTVYKTVFKSHILNHKDPTEVEMYHCKNYNYETRHKHSLRNHVLTHKEELKHKCNKCGYKSKLKSQVDAHLLTHKEKMHVCELCNFEFTSEKDLKCHMLVHENPIEVQMYKCETCDYETMYKWHLKVHALKHKDPSEVQMYKCQHCNYESKYKATLKKHILIHKDPTEVQMYKCQDCNYKSRYKTCLKEHMLVHKDPSEVHMYKCEVCNFVTKYKRTLQTHMLLHKDASEVKMYKCELCDHKTRFKFNLKLHIRKHERRSGIQK